MVEVLRDRHGARLRWEEQAPLRPTKRNLFSVWKVVRVAKLVHIGAPTLHVYAAPGGSPYPMLRFRQLRARSPVSFRPSHSGHQAD